MKEFQIVLSDDIYQKGDRISCDNDVYSGRFLNKFINRLLSFIGFEASRNMSVIEEPVAYGEGFTYNVQFKERIITWCGIKIK